MTNHSPHVPDSPPGLPPDLAWGADAAIRKLRPWARYSLQNTDFMWWEDPTGAKPPTWQEILDQIEQDKKNALAWLAKHKR